MVDPQGCKVMQLILFLILIFMKETSGRAARRGMNESALNTKFSEAEYERAIKIDMANNLVGTACSYSINRGESAASEMDRVDVFYQIDAVDAQEWLDLDLESPRTRANAFILTGLYEGIDRLTPWSTSRTHFAVPRSHPRNSQRELCLKLMEGSVKHPIGVPAYAGIDSILPALPYYWIKARNALVNSLGVIALRCGYLQHHESCLNNIQSSGRKWRKGCDKLLSRDVWHKLPAKASQSKHKRLNLGDPLNKPLHQCLYEGRDINVNASLRLTDPIRVKKILLMTAAWDLNWHHILFEGLLRLFHHVSFLRDNPDVYIHQSAEDVIISDPDSRCSSCRVMRESVLKFFNISHHRIRRGVVAADEVYLSRGIHCSSPLSHAVDLRNLAKTMISISWHLQDFQSMTLNMVQNLVPKPIRPVIVIQDRRCIDNDSGDLGPKCDERSWNASFVKGFTSEIRKVFSSTHDIVINNANQTLVQQVRLHSQASIVFALHGAGLTNVMFMPPGGLVVELTGFWDGRVLPLCGHYGPFSSVFGHSHLIWSFDSYSKFMNFSPAEVAIAAQKFYSEL